MTLTPQEISLINTHYPGFQQFCDNNHVHNLDTTESLKFWAEHAGSFDTKRVTIYIDHIHTRERIAFGSSSLEQALKSLLNYVNLHDNARKS